jgi:hypothetical protein
MAVAPDEVIVTVAPKATAPATGLNVGVAWAVVIVYEELTMALLLHPVLTARAFKVIASSIVTGPAYKVLDVVGASPFVV